jgi:hypothetical protein
MTSYPGRPGTRNRLFGPGLSPERQISAVPPATYCFGGRERRCRKLRNRRSARAAACPSVSVKFPELLSDRARSRHGVDPQRMTAAPCRGWPASGSGQAPAWPLGFWPEGVQAPTLKSGRRSFPKETRSALDGGGAPPDTERAIPGHPGPTTALHLLASRVVVDQGSSSGRAAPLIPANAIYRIGIGHGLVWG